MTTVVSKCCESNPVNELEDDFGKCSKCGEFTSFDEVNIAQADSANTPHKFQMGVTSADKLKIIGPKCGFSEDVINQFDPATISWVSERLGITAEDGVKQALKEGHFVINTADEIENDAHVKMAIDPGSGTVLHTLNLIAETATRVLATTNQKIVFHCAMGMERSVLACLWMMASYWRIQIHQALQHIRTKRPIALDRLDWITL